MLTTGWFERGMVCGIAAAAVVAISAGERAIGREIARVRADAASTVPAEQLPGIMAHLARAQPAADAGRTWLALYELQPAYEMQAAFAFAAASGVDTQEQFEVKWKAVGGPMPSRPGGRRRALFTEALAQSAESKAAATYHASLPYAQDSGLFGGLYYLGESQAFGKFAAFCRSLDIPPAGPAPMLRSLAPDLDALEAEILDAYGAARGTARQPFIHLSVTLKLARSLDQQGRRPGALLQYLLTRYRFALVRTSASAARVAQRQAAPAFAKDADHSIADFFLELAGDAPGAAHIVDDVLPAYRAAIE